MQSDIARLMEIRGAVTENVLSNPGSVRHDDYLWYIQNRHLWVIEADHRLVGFSASDPRNGSIWAVFVDPSAERRGFGQSLLLRACEDLASQGYSKARLTTQANSRAEGFYRRLGWQQTGIAPDGDVMLEKGLGQGATKS